MREVLSGRRVQSVDNQRVIIPKRLHACANFSPLKRLFLPLSDEFKVEPDKIIIPPA